MFFQIDFKFKNILLIIHVINIIRNYGFCIYLSDPKSFDNNVILSFFKENFMNNRNNVIFCV